MRLRPALGDVGQGHRIATARQGQGYGVVAVGCKTSIETLMDGVNQAGLFARTRVAAARAWTAGAALG